MSLSWNQMQSDFFVCDVQNDLSWIGQALLFVHKWRNSAKLVICKESGPKFRGRVSGVVFSFCLKTSFICSFGPLIPLQQPIMLRAEVVGIDFQTQTLKVLRVAQNYKFLVEGTCFVLSK